VLLVGIVACFIKDIGITVGMLGIVGIAVDVPGVSS